MDIEESGLVLSDRVIEFAEPVKPLLSLRVNGSVINSVTERTQALQAWKVRVASAVKAVRGEERWDPADTYAITLAFKFHLPNHGNQRLDVENFVKPVIDALAAGLFCPPQINPRDILHWDYDDSNFNTLLVHRLPDAATRGAEGVTLSVSSARELQA
ncbi:MAG: hypothetical protein OXL97_03010 [Chloroflexota bacterium]|nr:hypothetical protein [Chloroflexota bacterium]MDE2885493.1 hypothetical protein [Chloroflexota bacterium]